MRALTNFFHDQEGATAVEYALIATLIALAIIAAVAGLGVKVLALWTAIGVGW